MPTHPYRTGNYLPLRDERSAAKCKLVQGRIPRELAGGLYVRNGGAPALAKENKPDDLEPAYHWFDGDGMLTGVHFAISDDSDSSSTISPTFVNKYVLTDVFLASRALGLSKPILPSIATLLGSFATIHLILFSVFRAVFLAFCSFFTKTPLRHLSVANTSVLWHDGRALASCESGPLVEVTLPELDTVGYWSLEGDDGEPGMREGLLGWMKEWTTAHPKRDPFTGELMLFHMTFIPPFLHYSVVPSTSPAASNLHEKRHPTPRILGAPVPIKAPRMMHDCAASRTHTILLDLPLSLDPRNLLSGKPVISYNPSEPSRFAIFPRHSPDHVTWFEAPPCIIFHTAFASDEYYPSSPSFLSPSLQPEPQDVSAVSLVCCRLNSPRLVYSAGNLTLPPSEALPLGAKEACELYYYRFPFPTSPLVTNPRPSHAFPLAAIPFEFPTVPTSRVVGPSKYAYGCSVKHGNFDAALGGAAKIDCLVKANVDKLVKRGIERSQTWAKEGIEEDEELPVDSRTILEVLADQTPRPIKEESHEGGEGDVEIRIYELPENHFAQEASFVPRENPRGEDDGYLVFYVFDESRLDPETEKPRDGAKSELWVLDAWNMEDIVAKILLPQRVPYGLHGNWFTRDEIASQRQPTSIRQRPSSIPSPTS
ncbi:carotenoid oxygenase family protein [Sporobolomyces salmoneus]|uniref:carotenoid oxygenase family protein n=1 Tax=Sporobolomyces salmoneus TaxID=183962 RepID=UPI00316FD289